MPRTKQPKSAKPRTKFFTDNVDDMVTLFSTCADLSKKKFQAAYDRELNLMEEEYKKTLATFSEKDLMKTVGQFREEYAQAMAVPQSVARLRFEAPASAARSRPKRSLSSNPRDDGYVSDIRSATSSNSSQSILRYNSTNSSGYTDSSSRSHTSTMGPPSSWRPGKRQSRRRSSSAPQRYRTPLNIKTHRMQPITPKVCPDTPLTVLRRPRPGEMAVSMSGSPLLVNPTPSMDEMASCNIPLEDGTMISLMPNALRQSSAHIPFEHMRPDIVQQLTTLRNNLNIMVGMGQRLN